MRRRSNRPSVSSTHVRQPQDSSEMTLEIDIAAAALNITHELALPSPPVDGFDGSDAAINGHGQFASRELPVVEPNTSGENNDQLEARVVKVIDDFR
eukprot:9473864-Pyramimonas_sp.AAC.1